MFEPAQSNDPIQVPKLEPVKVNPTGANNFNQNASNNNDSGNIFLGDNQTISSITPTASINSATSTIPINPTVLATPVTPNGQTTSTALATPVTPNGSTTSTVPATTEHIAEELASIEKIASSLEQDAKNIAANSTNQIADESQTVSAPASRSQTPAPQVQDTTDQASSTESQVLSTNNQTSPLIINQNLLAQNQTSPLVADQVLLTKNHVSSTDNQILSTEDQVLPSEDIATKSAPTISDVKDNTKIKLDAPDIKDNASNNKNNTIDTAIKDTAGEQPVPKGIDLNKVYTSVVDVLKDQGVLSQDEANQVMVLNVSSGKSFSDILQENKFVKEEDLTRAKSVVNKIPFIKIAESGTDPQALSQIPEGVARNYKMLPISFNKDKNSLVVAMENPLDLSAIDFAEQKSGLKIITKYAMPSELERKIAENYSQSLSSEVTEALEQTSQVADDKSKKNNLKVLSGETIRQAPITKIVQTIVSFAMKARASDIHIEPQETRTRVRYRIDGILVEKLILPKSVHEAVVSRIKILSGLKIDEKRIPQDGRFTFVSGGKEVDLRVSTLPTVNGEKIVMRLLKKDAKVPGLEELGLNGMALASVKDAIKVPHGIILVTGPTGSGKTTTLYSVLHTINTPKVNIMTLEDPVEYQMTGVNQVQINQTAGLTFSSGLRSFLRQDPNIIMVGEIRDSETADLAVQASLTGHLVFSTLHTSSAAGAIPRLLDMGVEPFLLASSLTLAMAQRVVRKINSKFKETYKPPKTIVDDIKKVLGPRFEEWLRKNNKKEEDLVLYRAKEDRPQTEPEYKGRIAIFEVMNVSAGISKLILERKPSSEMETMAMNDGMLLMKQDGYLKALEGITTIEEVLRVAQI